MLAAVILVLIACVNVANMQFGRAALREKKVAIRGAGGDCVGRRWADVDRSPVVAVISSR
jgi:ABC-type branched-subunit amino acid transport system permease subunit